jgi:hypothetical protein
LSLSEKTWCVKKGAWRGGEYNLRAAFAPPFLREMSRSCGKIPPLPAAFFRRRQRRCRRRDDAISAAGAAGQRGRR